MELVKSVPVTISTYSCKSMMFCLDEPVPEYIHTKLGRDLIESIHE